MGPLYTKIGLIGDVHQEDKRLESAIGYLREQADVLVCVGDICDGPGDLDATCDLLVQNNVITVAGNHDRWALADEMRHLDEAVKVLSTNARAFLETLPRMTRLRTPAGHVLLCHGVGDNDMAEIFADTNGYALGATPLASLQRDASTQWMIGGHTHERMVRHFEGLGVINCGTLSSRCDEPGFGLADFFEMKVDWFSFDEGSRFVGSGRGSLV